jgi:hypothetical protein
MNRTLLPASIWFAAIFSALVWIARYSNSPGSAGAVPARWPVQSRLSLDPKRLTLVMFAHPRCPCTRSGLGELEKLLAQCSGQINAQVVFVQPARMGMDFVHTDQWRQAAAIPGVTVHCDQEETEAGLFHAETSGQALVYGRDGTLRFHGGITISRDHAGDNPGSSAILALLHGDFTQPVETPVFGCALQDSEELSSETTCKK